MENKLTIYNTLSRQKELFVPLHAPHVGMYVCGPTVYGDAHLGHARPAITFDILFRYLTHLGYKVRYVRNITDVGHLEHDADEGEDKIAKKARLEQLEPMEVVQYYLNRYHKAMEALNVLPPSIEPHASGHIIEQIDQVEEILASCAKEVTRFVFRAGEENKNLNTVQDLYEHLILHHFERKDMLVALGGGVVGDLAGFTAATYLRGVDFVQIPTTLLSQVDSSIGGKTGVDFNCYKNMVGAFHQPKLVYMNLSALKTLTDEQFACGMGEILKHGLIKDQGYYEWTICHRQEIMERSLEVLEEMISRSCEIKRDVVEKDPTEKGDRALLNFGHTLGHAIEKLKNFSLMHGQCVALGSLAASYLSMRRGQITEAELTAIKAANIAFGLPVSVEGVTPEEVVATTRSDKKMEAGKVKFILLNSIGDACIDRSVTDQEMEDAVKYLENITLL